MAGMRVESDAFGGVEIPADKYWGGQTERARRLFRIGHERFAPRVVHCFGMHKSAAASANGVLGTVEPRLVEAIRQAADEVAAGKFDDHFPLVVWQTGSGTQTNMNANEVIANRANELLGQPLGTRSPVHPNDHVNRCQSSNDSFPTIMHVAVLGALKDELYPALDRLIANLDRRAAEFETFVKIGKTHLQDALPVTVGMEFDSWSRQVAAAKAAVASSALALTDVAQGGTAAGSGVNAQPGFAPLMMEKLAEISGLELRAAAAPSQFMAAHDGLAMVAGALATLASAVLKICTDVRLLSASFGDGVAELKLPDDGLSSSIMPGKRNATVCEAVSQVCFRVMGNHAVALHANSMAALHLNTAKPVLLWSLLESIELLADGAVVLGDNTIAGLEADKDQLRARMERSSVLGTLLAPKIGYDAAAKLVHEANEHRRSIGELAIEQGLVTPEAYEALIDGVGRKTDRS